MIEINLDSWEAFEEQLKALDKKRLQNKSQLNFLYRGQKDQSFKLLSTLERSGQKKMTIKEYHRLVSVVKPQIESFDRGDWNILPYPSGIDKWLEENDSFIPHAFGCSLEFHETYSYMSFLRHFGFPSPMIDWTSSPYVAAYFAFRCFSSTIEKVSIYIFLESTSEIGLKTGRRNEPCIYRFGPYVKTDRRHFIQQSQYSVCILNDGEWCYVSHEEAFARCNPAQDVLLKFNIPYSERLKVLRVLDIYNINALSLFGSTESLMETMALREIDFRDRELL
ncbi:MAG: FRG domain-containing protein [Desulfobulbaceae bacterium]|nr:FRG domain-containing protein [Desulfobulbaceae bacterium]